MGKLRWELVSGPAYPAPLPMQTVEACRFCLFSYWEAALADLTEISKRYPQSAYVAMQRSLQAHWTYTQRVIAGTSSKFQRLQDCLASSFFSTLLDGHVPSFNVPSRRMGSLFSIL
eukprot:scaffold2440_cov108-Cylindrotheca_fusiformis.AAC.1